MSLTLSITRRFALLTLICLSSSAHALDLAALEGMLSNDSFFDGGGGAGGDMWGGGWDDFGGGGGGWDDWGSGGSSAPEKKKKAPKLEAVGSDKERFLQDMPDGTEKLPKKHKEIAREYLKELTQEIRGLHTELTSMKLNIALQESLRKTAEALPPALEKLELIGSKSSYLLTLFRKEFNGVRKKIIDVATDAEKARGAFTDLPGTADSNDFFESPAPSSRQKRAEGDARKKAERLVSGALKRLLADVEKVINHDATKRSLAAKKKDHTAPKNAGGDAAAWGGMGGDGWGDMGGGGDMWGGGWDDFGADGFGGGWGDSGGDFFGGGGFANWDMGGFDDDWGGDWGGGDWGGSDYGSSSESGGGYESGGTESSAVLGGTESVASDTSNAADDSDENFSRGSAPLQDLNSMHGDERTQHLAKELQALLKKWHDKLSGAGDASAKQKVIRQMLIDEAFVKNLRNLNEAIEIINSGEQPETADAARALESCYNQILVSTPLIIHGVKYVTPLLDDEREARELHAAQEASATKKSLDEARKVVKSRAKKRALAERFLHNVMHTILSGNNENLQKKITDELLQFEASRLDQVELLAKKLSREPLDLGDSANLLLASKGILERPNTQDTARALEQAAAAAKTEKPKEEHPAVKLAQRVRSMHDEVLKQLEPHVKNFSSVMDIMHSALPGGELPKTDEEVKALTTTIEARLKDSSLSATDKDRARNLLLPFSAGLWRKSKATMMAHLATQRVWQMMDKANKAPQQPNMSDMDSMADLEGAPDMTAVMGGNAQTSAPAAAAPSTAPQESESSPYSNATPEENLAMLQSYIAQRSGGGQPAAGEAKDSSAEGAAVSSGAEEGGGMMAQTQAMMQNPAIAEIAEKMQRGELSQADAMAQIQAAMGS